MSKGGEESNLSFFLSLETEDHIKNLISSYDVIEFSILSLLFLLFLPKPLFNFRLGHSYTICQSPWPIGG